MRVSLNLGMMKNSTHDYALLPQLIMENMSVLVTCMYMERFSGVPFSFLVVSGKNIKLFSLMFIKCRDEVYLVINLNNGGPGMGIFDSSY